MTPSQFNAYWLPRLLPLWFDCGWRCIKDNQNRCLGWTLGRDTSSNTISNSNLFLSRQRIIPSNAVREFQFCKVSLFPLLTRSPGHGESGHVCKGPRSYYLTTRLPSQTDRLRKSSDGYSVYMTHRLEVLFDIKVKNYCSCFKRESRHGRNWLRYGQRSIATPIGG